MHVLAILFMAGGGEAGGRLKPTKAEGVRYGHKDGRLWVGIYATGQFHNRTGWDYGGGHVGLRSSLGLVPNYVVLVPSM